MKNKVLSTHPERAQWANRLLIASLVGISYLTLFPFHFEFAARHSSFVSALLLGETLKDVHHFPNIFLNILLFVPFGFAISLQLRKRGVGRTGTLLLTFAAGALASYIVEVLQYFIPIRNSGWDDVAPNSMGALVGFLIFESCGAALLRQFSKYEVRLEEFLSPNRTAALLLVYFGLCFGLSIPLQMETSLNNWDPLCSLFVGNDGSGKNSWKGRVARLQIWNREIPERMVRRMTIEGEEPDSQSGSLVSYDFTTPAPYVDQKRLLPALELVSTKPLSKVNIQGLGMDGTSWLGTTSPVAGLTRKIQGTNQFTIRIICAPEGNRDTDGQIVSISRSTENANLYLRQEGSTLIFWFRNALSEEHSSLSLNVPNVFESEKVRDIVASYDGSDASIYLDGKRVQESYRLSAGASLAHTFHFLRTAELGGYIAVYQTLIFVPPGLLIGTAVRKWKESKTSVRLMLVLTSLLPPVILELILAWVSGRGLLAGNVVFSVLLFFAGVWMVNADRSAQNRSPYSRDAANVC